MPAFVAAYCANAGDVERAAVAAGVELPQAFAWAGSKAVKKAVLEHWRAAPLGVALADARVRDLLADPNTRAADVIAAAALVYKRLGADAESSVYSEIARGLRHLSAAERIRAAVDFHLPGVSVAAGVQAAAAEFLELPPPSPSSEKPNP